MLQAKSRGKLERGYVEQTSERLFDLKHGLWRKKT